MASAIKGYRYAQGNLNRGNLARDLDWDVREREAGAAGEKRRIIEKAPPRVHQRQAVVLRKPQAVSIPAVISVMGILAVSVLLLLSYVELTTLSAGTVALREELEALEAQNVLLTAAHEQMFDMAAVKEAAAAAGMARPTGSQVCYLDMSSEDSVEVYAAQSPSLLQRVLSSLHHGVYAVVEYFH